MAGAGPAGWTDRGQGNLVAMARRTVLVFLLAFGCPAAADRIDDFLLAEMDAKAIPGLSVVVLKGGEVRKIEAYGVTALENGEAVKPDTKFQIGSLSKQFAAAAVLLLVEEGKVGLDDGISAYAPGCPAWEGVTVRHLMNHTSGIPDFSDIPGFSFTREYTVEPFLTMICLTPLRHAPGERFLYSSAGYSLLLFVVECALGREKTFEEFVRERIFERAGMPSTRFFVNGEREPGDASGYRRDGNGMRPGVPLRPRLSAASGGIVSTAADLARYEEALLRHAILTPESARAMVEPARLNGGGVSSYGFGWYIRTENGETVYQHTGSTSAGFRSCYRRYPADDLAVVLLMNLNAEDFSPDPIARRVAELYREEFTGAPADPPQPAALRIRAH